jgi:16S rRNA (cytidine1402-2'-O)-methyltransferase
MPSNSPTPDDFIKGGLYVVALPIGHPNDITLRALEVLGSVDVMAAEDTRSAARFLKRHGLRVPLISCHEHNEEERTRRLLTRLRSGDSVALVSEAGTPCVSDPGYRLVCEAVNEGIPVVPIPGVSAAITALSASGLPTDSFVFIGFPPRKKSKRHSLLASLADQRRTLIFYESPRRIVDLLETASETLGDRKAVLAREMTKSHEEFLRGTLGEIVDRLTRRDAVKGEITLLVAGCDASAEGPAPEQIREEIRKRLCTPGATASRVSREVARAYGLSKRDVYEQALAVTRSGYDGAMDAPTVGTETSRCPSSDIQKGREKRDRTRSSGKNGKP